MSRPLKVSFRPSYLENPQRPYCIVIGGSGSVGSEVAAHFYELGFSLVLLARNIANLELVKKRLQQQQQQQPNESRIRSKFYDSSLYWQNNATTTTTTTKQEIHCVAMDLGCKKSTENGLDKALSIAGRQLEVVLNCAGEFTPTKFAVVKPDPLDAIHRELYVEVQAMATVTARCCSVLASLNRGTVIFLTTTAGYWSNFIGLSANAAGAGAKLSFLEAAFEEYRLNNVRLCAMLAWGLNSRSTDTLQRWNANFSGDETTLQQPSDIARGMVFCVSSRSPIPELVMHPHQHALRGFKRLTQFQNMKAMPERPALLLDGATRHNGRRAAIVTGASKGIGLSCAERLAREGYDIALIARSPEPLEDARNQLLELANDPKAEMRGFACDVADRVAFDKCVDDALRWLGRCDVLVANAGTNRRRSAVGATWNVWLNVVDTNLAHMMQATARIIPLMLHQGGGTLAYIGSHGGSGRQAIVYGDPGIAGYFASKAALNGFCGSIWEDLREHNIKVTELVLGLVSTPLGRRPMGEFQRLLKPAEMIQPEECGDQLMFAVNSSPTSCPTRICCWAQLPGAKYHVDPDAIPKHKLQDRLVRTPKL